MDEIDDRRAWAESGALWLTGWVNGPVLGPPKGFVRSLGALGRSINSASRSLGREVDFDPLATLVARAGLRGFTRGGATSCGGSSHLLRCADGWLALSLPRPEDVDLLPAWLEDPAADGDLERLASSLQHRALDDVVDRGAELGLAIAGVPARPGPGSAPVMSRLGEAEPVDSLEDILVVDLSSLWAGPLCGKLLADAGADVVKVESRHRPDGARADPSGFFDLVNAGKRMVALDLDEPEGRFGLKALIEHADVVIEASRPRALRHLGIDAEAVVRGHNARVWLSITGHGRGPIGEHRVGFGDDAAAAGGLVGWDGSRPCFVADAVADPLTGMVAAGLVLDALTRGGRHLVDVSLAGTASRFAGPTRIEPEFESTPPLAPIGLGVARDLGADTSDVFDGLGIGS